MRNATYGLLALDAILGCSLLLFGPWWLIPVGIAIALFAVGYSTGPYPLSHHGLGDIAVVVFFGLVPVMLTAYLQAGSWIIWPVALRVAIAIGLLGANVLIVNNYRDYEDDKKTHHSGDFRPRSHGRRLSWLWDHVSLPHFPSLLRHAFILVADSFGRVPLHPHIALAENHT